MMLKFSFLVCITWLLPLLTFGQQPDTLGSRQFAEVQITARRIALFTPGSRQTKIDSAALSQNKAGNLADLLQTRTPIFVKTYGQNMLATVSFRGTSAQHTAVLWNGFSITQPTLGLTDLSLLPVNSLKSVEILHGSGSANFGSGAIGGAILLGSKTAISPGLKLGGQQDFGSFGRKFTQAEGSFGTEKFGIDASVFHLQAENNFSFINYTKFGAPRENQENAALEQYGFTANFNYRANPNNLFSFRNWYTHSNTQAQPTMVSANTNARNLNKNLRLMAEWAHNSGLGNTNVRAAFFNDFMNFRDQSLNSLSEVQTYQVQAEHGFSFKNKINLNVGAEGQHFAAQVSDYGRNVTENRAAVFGLLRYDVSRTFALNFNWRQAFIQRFDPPASPTFGFNLAVLTQERSVLNWKGNISRGYRVPTLNDRFWPPGNPNLKPEESLNFESGLAFVYSPEKLTFETEVTGYQTRVDNWIQWVPGPNNQWAPKNLKKVQTKGLEAKADLGYTFSGWKLQAGWNYAYTISEQVAVNQSGEPVGKQLIYVPLSTATAHTSIAFKSWFADLSWQYTGYRFTSPENDRWLPAYHLLNAAFGKTITLNRVAFQLIGRINNLQNTIYQNLEYYAMPGRHYNLSLRFHLDNPKKPIEIQP